jgi:hypothetical protein
MTMDRYLAIHEAGHVVVADAVGITPVRVEDAGEQLQVAIAFPADATPHEHFLGAAIAFAGMIAQALQSVVEAQRQELARLRSIRDQHFRLQDTAMREGWLLKAWQTQAIGASDRTWDDVERTLDVSPRNGGAGRNGGSGSRGGNVGGGSGRCG